MEANPELAAEQAHVDRAYRRLDELRAQTQEMLASVLSQGRGVTAQFREERDVIVRTSLARLEQLDIGDQALCFGRIDRLAADGAEGSHGSDGLEASDEGGVESFHIGRLGISSQDLEPLVVDWRAPVAEPFYRATGRDPMGLLLRRHLAASGRSVTDIEDERFAPVGTDGAHAAVGEDATAGGALSRHNGSRRADELDRDTVLENEIGGPGALLAAISSARSGRMRDIVSTIQKEQDEIIRAPLAGVLVVQGGPGTGKTAVALHRAAYLLYTHRFPLERQGVLVVGPNPLFLRYIEHVLPSLGESGVTLSTASGLVHGVEVRSQERADLARLKGDIRMARLVARAVRTRQRPLRRQGRIAYGSVVLRLGPEDSASIISSARRRPGTHNSRRRFVEQLVIRRLAGQYLRLLDVHARRSGHDPGSTASLRDVPGAGTPVGDAVTGEDPRESSPAERRFSAGGGPRQVGPVRPLQPVRPSLPVDARAGSFEGNGGGGDDSPDGRGPSFDIADFARGVRAVPQFSEMLDRMWPRLSAEELLHDLFGAKPLIALAGEGLLDAGEQAALYRERSSAFADIPWSEADLALIDEARVLLGPRRTRPVEGVEHEEEPRTYGHIVLDEAQDLSPMQLRMISRRSLSGSITAVGDIAQATGPWAPGSWEDVTAYLPDNRPARTAELSVSYRTPAEVVEVARHVLEEAVPGLAPPTAVRRTGIPPNFEALAGPDELLPAVVSTAAALVEEVSPGTTAVLVPASMVGELAAALDSEGMADCDPASAGLTAPLSLLPVDLANGLEFDAVVVVEPAAIVEESPQGLRSLYMALTRPTRRLSVVHFRPLPVVMTS